MCIVLLVDDDPTTNFLHRRAITKVVSKASISEALNGHQALELLRLHYDSGLAPPEFIFLDINMPHLDGWGFLEGYRALPVAWRSQSRVYMLTTSLNPDDHSRARSFDDVIDVVDKIMTKEKFAVLLEAREEAIANS